MEVRYINLKKISIWSNFCYYKNNPSSATPRMIFTIYKQKSSITTRQKLTIGIKMCL